MYFIILCKHVYVLCGFYNKLTNCGQVVHTHFISEHDLDKVQMNHYG